MIGIKFKVLDKGFIEVIDVMGTDESIVAAARVSYQRGTRTVSDDETLIRYLMRNNHSSPFEMCSIILNIKMPIYCARQMVRHRTAKMNEISGRYSIMEDECHEIKENEWRYQNTTNKQGSLGFLPSETGDGLMGGNYLSKKEKEFQKISRELYEERLQVGVAREQARNDLPLSLYTQFFWKMDLRNLFHFLKLRMDSHAQLEIRSYANVIGNEIVAKIWPISWNAFVDYQLNSVTLSGPELELIRWMNDNNKFGKSSPVDRLSKREKEEFSAKMEKLGMNIIL